VIKTKICTKCHQYKNDDFINFNKTSKGKTTGSCKQCKKEYLKEWYSKNNDRVVDYRIKNKEKTTKRNKEDWDKNKELRKINTKKWREENKEHLVEYRKNNRERDNAAVRRNYHFNNGKLALREKRAFLKTIPNDLTKKDWQECVIYFNNKCAYCGSSENLEREHVIPTSLKGTTTKANIVIACRCCNGSKSNYNFIDWYRQQKFYSKHREDKIILYIGTKS